MALWHNVGSTTRQSTGKFKSQRRVGTELELNEQHAGWSFQVIEHRAGSTVRRTVYNVAISDPAGFRAGYLRGFLTAARARAAAQSWIDERVAKARTARRTNTVGAIPQLPSHHS